MRSKSIPDFHSRCLFPPSVFFASLPLQQTSPDGSDDVDRSRIIKELEPVHRTWNDWKEKEKVSTQRNLDAWLSPSAFSYRSHPLNLSDLRNIPTIQELVTSEKLAAADPDEDMRLLAQEEVSTLKSNLDDIRNSLKHLLLPPDPLDSNGAIMELRPGVGGSESACFTSEVTRMYMRFAQSQFRSSLNNSSSSSNSNLPWEVEMLSSTPMEVTTASSGGGDALKEAIIQVKGDNAFKYLRYEAGVHRVQRVGHVGQWR